MSPPFHFVGFVEVDVEFFAASDAFEGPGGFVDVDGVWEGTLVIVRCEADKGDTQENLRL